MKITPMVPLAMAAALALTLVGCSYPGDDEDRAAFRAGHENPQPVDDPAPADSSEAPADNADEDTDDGAAEEPSTATTDLGVEDGQVQYLRAVQAFSPRLERWVVDEEAGEVTYTQYNCLGRTQAEGVATLEPIDGGTDWYATWVGESPLDNVAAESVRLKITEDELVLFADVATSRTDIEAGNYSRMCAEAGQAVAEFIF